jgi:hypothetical protein
VAPIWNHKCHFRSAEDVVAEMKELHERADVDLPLFQDEFFVSSKRGEKLRILQEHGFYTRAERELTELDSCGAHSPRV